MNLYPWAQVRLKKQLTRLKKRNKLTLGSYYKIVIQLLVSCQLSMQYLKKLYLIKQALLESGLLRCPVTNSLSLLCRMQLKLQLNHQRDSEIISEVHIQLSVKMNWTIAKNLLHLDVFFGVYASSMLQFLREESSVHLAGIFLTSSLFQISEFPRTNLLVSWIIMKKFLMKL